jgi:hypothetical protein
MAVIELKSANYVNAFKCSKKAVMLIEPIIFNEMKNPNMEKLRQDKGFLDRLQVLLVAYFNLGVSQCKVGNINYAKTVFEHGFKMAKKFLGEDHFFAQKFSRRIEKPLGSNLQTSPQRLAN